MPYKRNEDRLTFLREWRKPHAERLNREARVRYAANPEKYRERVRIQKIRNPGRHRWYQLKSSYGITREGYQSLFDVQKGVCAICGDGKPLCVDHCHSTNTVRGLLCDGCNKMLGHAKDNVNILYKATEYLGKYNGTSCPVS